LIQDIVKLALSSPCRLIQDIVKLALSSPCRLIQDIVKLALSSYPCEEAANLLRESLLSL